MLTACPGAFRRPLPAAMTTRWPVALAVVAAVLTPARVVSAQPDETFQSIRNWAPERGAKVTAADDTLRLERGWIWTDDTWMDFALRFEYRPIGPAGQADLLINAHATPERELHTYQVTLTPGAERGRLAAVRRSMLEATFTAAPPAADATAWTAVEVRAQGDRLSVSLDGVVVSTGVRADARSGYIGFAARRGGVELRAMRTTRLVVPPALATLPKANDEGITPPAVTRRVPPAYTRAAMRAVAQGVAILEFAVLPDGSVGDIRVVKAPHPELASAAINCLHQWRFTSATRAGVPVAVIATMELHFRLK
jgi:TonB family protein